MAQSYPTANKPKPAYRKTTPRRSSGPPPLELPDPTPLDTLRYRYHYGVNLGSVYVVERWLTESAFPSNTPGHQSSELAAVTANVIQFGIEDTRTKFEARWTNFMKDDDWTWLCKTAHCTSVRLPIGYFTLGPDFCHSTPFEQYSQVYLNAWKSVKAMVARAWQCGIGVLIDFHALPGGANTAEHSGTNSGQAELWGNATNLALAQKCLIFLANEIKTMEGVVGLQIVNEAIWDAPSMFEYYDQSIAAICKIDASIPLFISDGWNVVAGLEYVQRKNKIVTTSKRDAAIANPIIIDNHAYFCFTDADRSCNPQQIIDQVAQLYHEIDGRDGNVLNNGAAQICVGEWSCVLSEDTRGKVDSAQNDTWTQKFGTAQCSRFQQKTGGQFFWTYKMDWMDGGEWGFVAQTKNAAVIPPPSLLLSTAEVTSTIARAKGKEEEHFNSSVDAHVNYWSRRGGAWFEHWRYLDGWCTGWDDALIMFSMRVDGRLSDATGGDKIGMLDVWVRKRIGDSGFFGDFVWEFESGLRKGIADFYDCAGV